MSPFSSQTEMIMIENENWTFYLADEEAHFVLIKEMLFLLFFKIFIALLASMLLPKKDFFLLF